MKINNVIKFVMDKEPNPSPHISVVIPLYNKIDFIEEALDSIFFQTYRNFEVIVVDDGSTDGGCEFVADNYFDQVKLIKINNSGPGIARNVGVSNSKFQLIAFIDADDIWAPSHLEVLINLLKKNNYGAGLYATVGMKLPNKKNLNFTELISNEASYIDYAAALINQSTRIHTSSVMISKDVFNSIGGFASFRPGQDIHFWLKVSLNYPVLQSKSITSCYRLNTGGIIDTADIFQLEINNFSPKSPEEVSPFIAALSSLKALYPKESYEYKKVQMVINANILKMLRVFLANDKVSRAKILCKLFASPINFKIFCFSSLYWMPSWLIRLLILVFKITKRVKCSLLASQKFGGH
jgi:glycosyltransferase involved in cell wall biosynthesis